MSEFKYLGTIPCKHGTMEGEVMESAVRGRHVKDAQDRIMKGGNVSMRVKKGISLPILSYA